MMNSSSLNDMFNKCLNWACLEELKRRIDLKHDGIRDILKKIFDKSKEVFGKKMECRIMASTYYCLLKDAFTISINSDISTLNDNQIAIIQLIPPLQVEYHFITLCSVGNDFEIYSTSGAKYIEPFRVDKNVFIDAYNKLETNSDNITNYDENIEEIPIVKLWKIVTNDDLLIEFNRIYNDIMNDDDTNDDATNDEKRELWEDLIKNYKNKIVLNPRIIVMTRDIKGGRKIKCIFRNSKKRKSGKKKNRMNKKSRKYKK